MALRLIAVSLLLSAAVASAQPGASPHSPDAAALSAAGVEPTAASLRQGLDALAEREMDDRARQIILHGARLSRARGWDDCLGPLVQAYLRLEDPLVRHAVARELAAGGVRSNLPAPQTLLRSARPAAVLLGIEILAAEGDPAAIGALPEIVGVAAGPIRLAAIDALRRVGDESYVRLVRQGLHREDPATRVGHFRLLPANLRPGGYQAFGEAPPPAPRPDQAPATVLGAPAVTVTLSGPQLVIDLVDAEPRFDAARRFVRPIRLGRRLGAGGPLLVVAPTQVRVQNDDGRLLWLCDHGAGPQNDAIPVGDGSFLIADGGAFDAPDPEALSRIYVYSPAQRAVLWSLPVDTPQTVRFAEAMTLLVARGAHGLAWLDYAGQPVREVAFDAPCRWAELLADGDALAAVGQRVVRVSPAGAESWSWRAPGEVRSLAVLGPAEFLAAVDGAGVLRVDTTDPANPAVQTLVAFEDDAGGYVTITP